MPILSVVIVGSGVGGSYANFISEDGGPDGGVGSVYQFSSGG